MGLCSLSVSGTYFSGKYLLVFLCCAVGLGIGRDRGGRDGRDAAVPQRRGCIPGFSWLHHNTHTQLGSREREGAPSSRADLFLAVALGRSLFFLRFSCPT